MEIGIVTCVREPLDDRQHAPQLFVRGHGLGIRPRAFAADVEQIGPVGDQLQRMSDCRIRVKELAAVRKAVGRDVDDPHHQRPPRQFERACAKSPLIGDEPGDSPNEHTRLLPTHSDVIGNLLSLIALLRCSSRARPAAPM